MGLVALAATAVGGLVAGLLTTLPAGASVPGSPTGSAERISIVPGGMSFSGWAQDPNSPDSPVTVYVTLDGKSVATSTANLARPDLADSHPNAVASGFKFTKTLPEGTHTVCLKARNIGVGADTQLACQSAHLVYSPWGRLDTLTASAGHLHAVGWALDRDRPTGAVNVSVRIDSAQDQTVVAANRNRPDVGRTYTGSGPNHGFDVTMPMGQGSHYVCVIAINIGYGTSTKLGCRSLTLSESPVGHLDVAQQYGGKLQVRGWAFDPNAKTSSTDVRVTVDGSTSTYTARSTRSDVAAKYAGVGSAHGFDLSLPTREGQHQVCVVADNVSYGYDHSLGCRTVTINFTPSASLTSATASSTGAVTVRGWATDPDTRYAIPVRIAVNGKHVSTVTANGAGSTYSGHNFGRTVNLRSGRQVICATGVNTLFGTRDSAPSCRTLTLSLGPAGAFESLRRAPGSADLLASGWAFDPDTSAPIQVAFSVDGHGVPAAATTVARSDIRAHYPMVGSGSYGFARTIAASDGEHRVCATAYNAAGTAGASKSLGCKLIIAVHPNAPSAPRSASASGGYGSATVRWAAPASDGGAPWSSYTVTVGSRSVTVGPTTTSAVVSGLASKTTYSAYVVARNVAGTSARSTTVRVTTMAGPPPQTTPAPVSTSRYIRNVGPSASSSDLAKMRAEGAADARNNPSNHRYMILLDIGGQDQYDRGVVLSATTKFVPYSSLVRDVQAYIDGYHSAQKASAPATIAIGTNNDMDVNYTSGKAWADNVVDPIRSYAARYPGLAVAGANDIEPGFRASYGATKTWLSGYLANTSAQFVFNGSADGCAWTVTGRGCNNGWSMAGLYYLAAGASPSRSINLPQIYNTTMAGQWKYISLTGVVSRQPRINFGGVLTEYTACAQASCYSMSGRSAWSAMWSNLQSDSRLRVGTLPFSTDLRIDR